MPEIIWRGITVNISHSTESWHKPYDHIELRAAEPLPVTETGYRSHFLFPEELALFDGVEGFVREMLDTAVTPEWEEQFAQPSLF